MCISKTSDYIHITIKIPNPSQEPQASSKAQNEDLKDMHVLCTFKTKIESQNWNIGVSKTSDHIQIKIKMPNPSQEHSASSKAVSQELKDNAVRCIFKIKIDPKFGIWVYQRPMTISKSRSRCQTSVRNLQHPPKTKMRT